MKIRNIEKWYKDLETTYKYYYHCKSSLAIGKHPDYCDLAVEKRNNYFEECHTGYFECVALFNPLVIEKDGNKVYLSVTDEDITFYRDRETHFEYLESACYDWFATKMTFIVYLTNVINKYLMEGN